MDIAQVNRAGKAIIEALNKHAYGSKNAEALREITKLADDALYASEYNAYISEKAGSIKHYAGVLYSTRKHAALPQDDQIGAEGVHHFILSDASILANWMPFSAPPKE